VGAFDYDGRMERISATYLIETALPVEDAASALAGEQSSGTFVAVPGETEELKQRFAARVESIKLLGETSTPSLPGARSATGKFHQAEVVVSWSVENMGYNLPTLISTIQGNLYELRHFSGLKLVDVEFPASFVQQYPGPRFGVKGTRKLTDVSDKPLIGTIIKPSIGMSPDETATLVKTLVEAGIDFIKDDELMANPPHSPFDERVDAIMRVINDYAQHSGKKVMYAFNISDELDLMLDHYNKVLRSGGTAVMMSLNSVGLTGVKKICDIGELPVHGHRNGWGMLNRAPMLGIEFPAYQKLWRLAGVDQLHVNGIKNKFWESDDSVVRSIGVCLAPLGTMAKVLPVVSSGQWGGQAPETFRRTQTVDLLYLAGGGIMAHPAGPAGGVQALREAWEAAVAGLTWQEAIDQNPLLKQSNDKFGK
jgi:ribulose-bisphosphate carboxylase large chain